MPATIIMGGQWGDEGKGKLTDALAGARRWSSAQTAAPTPATRSDHRGTFKMHLVPSGILNPDCVCVVGAGVVIDPIALLREIDTLQGRGIATDQSMVSARAHVVLPYHAELDRAQEISSKTAKSAPPCAASARPMPTRPPGTDSASPI